MRKIKMASISAGPDGIMLPGVHVVPAGKANELVVGGHAEYADETTPSPEETATVTAPEKRERSKKQ